MRLFLLAFLLLPVVHAAPTDRYEELSGEEDDFHFEGKPWKEVRGEIPPIPGEKHWTPVRMDTLPKHQRAFIALDSVSVGKEDQVVRYWISIRSDGGGRMTTYEGMHCGQKRYIVYAYGHPHRKPPFRKVRDPKWKSVFGRGPFRYRVELMTDLFCAGATPRTPRQIRQSAAGRYQKANPWDNWTNDD